MPSTSSQKSENNTAKSSSDLKISFVIPVYNESGHLEEFLKWIDNYDFPIETEFVIVDDCSKDGSVEIVKNYSFKNPNVITHFKDKNEGKGAAVHTGIELATGDFIGVQDADFEYDIKDIPGLLEPLIEGRADVVYGSRFKKTGSQVHRTFHYLINRFLTMTSNLLSGLYLSDMETCYKIFRADIIKNINLNSKRFGFEPEVTAKIARLHIRAMEMPISYFPRNYIEGKKITWKDGVAALRHIVFYNLFVNKKEFFKEELPAKYLPKEGHWL
jgi:glycosyltransferase involved in cell wall biosynthesis